MLELNQHLVQQLEFNPVKVLTALLESNKSKNTEKIQEEFIFYAKLIIAPMPDHFDTGIFYAHFERKKCFLKIFTFSIVYLKCSLYLPVH